MSNVCRMFVGCVCVCLGVLRVDPCQVYYDVLDDLHPAVLVSGIRSFRTCVPIIVIIRQLLNVNFGFSCRILLALVFVPFGYVLYLFLHRSAYATNYLSCSPVILSTDKFYR